MRPNRKGDLRDALNVAHSMLTIIEAGGSLDVAAWDERMARIERALGLDTPRSKACRS